MLEFKIMETLKQNMEILEVIKDYTFKVKKETIKHLLHTNLQVIEPTEYKMKNNDYINEFLENFLTKSREHLYVGGIISCPYVEDNKLKDILILVPKTEIVVAN